MPDSLDLSKMESVPVEGPYGFQRLHRYWREANGDLWDDLWINVDTEYWSGALKGDLSVEYERWMKYLKKNDRILEAGCGVGQVVLSLRARGFDCHGLDYAEKVISTLKNHFPKVPFVQGDIRDICYPDDYFDCYISLGVIEHFIEGQDQMLGEAARVVKSGGYIFLTVPALNQFRKSKIRKSGYLTKSDLPFFESCISSEELNMLLKNNEFEVLEEHYINPVMPFVQETFIRPLYRLIEDSRFPRNVIDRALRILLPKKVFGHMIMIIARKK